MGTHARSLLPPPAGINGRIANAAIVSELLGYGRTRYETLVFALQIYSHSRRARDPSRTSTSRKGFVAESPTSGNYPNLYRLFTYAQESDSDPKHL